MAEYKHTEEKIVDINKPITFINNTKSPFAVGVGITFHEDGVYQVLVNNGEIKVDRIDPAYIKAGTVEGGSISRQAAIDVLSLGKEILSRVLNDMDVVGAEREKYSWGLRLIESNIEDIKELPSAQPEIIRCKDCKFWTHIKRTNRYWCKTDDGLYDLNPSPNDFCSRAERRTDEHSD